MEHETGREPTDAELLASALAHRACCGTEHNPETGKLHGYCVVCGVPWPCATAERFMASGARPMPDTPAPDEERRTVCVYDKYDPDYVYRPDDGGEYRMQVDRRSGTTPAAPVIGSNQCEHGHLARVCETCELIAAEARIAELEAENTALVAKLNTIRIWSITEDDRIGMFAKGYASARRWVAMYF